MDGENLMRPHLCVHERGHTNVDNYKNLKHDLCSFPEKSIPDAQCQVICLENIHAGSIIWTEQVTFKNIYMYTYTCTCSNN